MRLINQIYTRLGKLRLQKKAQISDQLVMHHRSLALFILFILVGYRAEAGSRSFTAEELFKRYKDAVVKIVIRQQHIPIGTGTGFFVGREGVLITNHHVMKSVLKTGSFTADFILADGRKINEFKVSNCRDDRGLDLCIIKLAVKPKKWFEVTQYEPSPGETVYAIGHPQGLDFSISNGIISAVRLGPGRIQEIQVTAAISSGNSGGPFFNSHATLVGVASKFYKEGQNLNFGIGLRELRDFLKKPGAFLSLAQYRKNSDALVAKTVKKINTEMMEPAYVYAETGKRIADVKGFKEVEFNFGDAKIRIPIPKLFTSCEKLTTRKNSSAFQCTTDSNSATFSVSRVSSSPNAPLISLDGKKAVKEKPLPIVELLMQDGTWSDYESKLSASNRKYLYSVPGETACRKIGKQTSLQAFFEDDAVQCRFSIFNDLEPDAYSHSIWIQRGRYIYDFYVWMEDAGLADYMNNVPSLAVLGARSGEELPSVADLPFKIDPLPAFNLLKAEELKDGTASFVFSRSRAPASGATPVFMVNVLKSSISKRDLTKKARALFEGTLDGFNTELEKRTLKLQQITADQMPGMVQTAFAQKKENKLAVFHATLIDDKSTFMIYAYGDSAESETLIDDFMKMTMSIRRTPQP